MTDGAMATVDLGIEGLEDAVEIGRGGFGSVYRARQQALSRTVAVKLLRDAVTDERVRLRFERECWAMGTLANHPNIITVHGSGFTERGQPYIVMEFTPNGALSDRLEAEGPLSWDDVLSIAVKTAGALETAHRSGVLHRDVKPENILISAYGEPQLADFGIARLQGSEETKTDTLTASIAHVSPELLAGERPSALSDVYALGSTLYMLLAGSPAFIRDTDQSIVPALTRITSDPVPDLRSRGVPGALCEVIERMMAKDTSARLPTAEAAGRALQDCQRRLGQRVCALTIVGQPGLLVDTEEDGATNTISPEALAALPGVDSGTVQGVVADAVLAASPTAAPPAPGPAAALAPAPEPAPAPAARRRLPVLVGLGVLVIAAAIGGATVILGGEEPAVVATVTDGGIDRATLRSVRLEPADLDGSWTLDADLERQGRVVAPAFLCTGAELDAVPLEVVAYRSGSPGPRVAQVLRSFAPGAAAAFMASLHDEVSCLERLGGIEGVHAEALERGDEGMLLTYTKPGSSITLGVALVFERVGDVVSQVIHLDYPSADPALTEELMQVTDEKLAALSG